MPVQAGHGDRLNAMTKHREPRWWPTWRGGLLFAFYLAVVIWLQVAKPLSGDQGASNVLSQLVGALAFLTLLLWFLFFSHQSWRLRLSVMLAVVVLVVGLSQIYRIERFSGDMIPKLTRRGAEVNSVALEDSITPSQAVDLATATANDFPQFLGPGRNLRIDHLRLARDWDTNPPELLWRQEIGAGWSGFAVVNGHAVTMEQRGDLETVTCYDASTGKLEWARSIATPYTSVIAGGGPRATPSIDDGMVYTLGVSGQLWALDGATGEVVWQKDLLAEYGANEETELLSFPYGRSNSTLVVGDLVIVTPGGPAESAVSLAAYNKKTGEKVWQGHQRQISCSSPNAGTLGGVAQILITNENTVSGHDQVTGALLWEHPWKGATNADSNVSQAVALPPDRVFISKGYGLGASLLQLQPQADNTFEVKTLWHENRVMRTKFTNVAIRDGHVYGLSDGILECVELETGRRVWKGGRYKHGQILMVGDLLLVLAESGELLLVEATPEKKNSVLGRFQAIEGKTWNNLALYGDLVLLRNAEEAAAYRLPLDP